MANKPSGSALASHSHWPTTAASLMVGAGFFALWFWLLPGWLGFRPHTLCSPVVSSLFSGAARC